MKPESILHADLLDIVFEKRNKAYGAYNLRKNYNRRLAKAVGFTFLLVFLLSLSLFVKAKYFRNKESLVKPYIITEVHLDPIKEPKKKEQQPEQKPATKKPLAQVSHTNIRIVPDDKLDKTVAEVDDLDDKMISSINKDGVAASEDDFLPPTEEESGSGSVIEPEKEDIKQKEEPLLHADVMPEFPGGAEAFNRFMLRNLKQPDDLEEGEKAVVVIKFVVEADGTIVKAEVVRSDRRYDTEVMRVVRMMPRWKPGIQAGKFVPVYFNLPVTFMGQGN